MKLQFLDVQAYLNDIEQSNDKTEKIIIKGNLLKRVADWHNEICGVLTKQFVNNYTPDFVKEVIEDEKLTVPNNSGARSDIMCDPFNLHAALLVKASGMMITCLESCDLSGDTVSAIKNWFELFEQPEFDDFLRCGEKYEEWKNKLSCLNLSYKVAIDANTIGYGELGQFFDPGTLFLYLAHAVFMECYDPSFQCLVRNSQLERTAGQNKSEETFAWQQACGSLVKWRFPYDSFKGMTGSDYMNFPILSSLKPMSLMMEDGKVPPVHVVHHHLLEKMIWVLDEKVQGGEHDINGAEMAEFEVLDDMFMTLKSSTDDQIGKLKVREKFFRSAFRKGGGFRIDRDFNNDLFLMGDDSDSIANLIKRRKQKKENREGLGNPF